MKPLKRTQLFSIATAYQRRNKGWFVAFSFLIKKLKIMIKLIVLMGTCTTEKKILKNTTDKNFLIQQLVPEPKMPNPTR